MSASAAPNESAEDSPKSEDAAAEGAPGERAEAEAAVSGGKLALTMSGGEGLSAMLKAAESAAAGGVAEDQGTGETERAVGEGGPAPLPEAPVPGPALDEAHADSGWRPSTWFLVATALITAAVDLGSKEWAKNALAGPDLKRTAKHITAIPGYVDFIFAQNPGGAWSFLRSVPDGLRRPFFLFVSSAAIVFIVTVYRRLERRQWAMRWGLPLALGGAIGNLADRVRYGWVVDFIDMYWRRGEHETHWPTYNIADVAIVAGVALMALDLLSLRRHPSDAPRPAETAGGAA